MPVLRTSVSCFVAAAMVCSLKAFAADSLVLFDFNRAFNLTNATTQDARVRLEHRDNNSALRIETGASASWPGVTLRAPATTTWDLSRFGSVVLRLRNVGSDSVTVYCRLDNDRADGINHCVTASTTISPGAVATLTVPLTRHGDDKLDGKLFGMRGYPKSSAGEHAIDPQELGVVARPEV